MQSTVATLVNVCKRSMYGNTKVKNLLVIKSEAWLGRLDWNFDGFGHFYLRLLASHGSASVFATLQVTPAIAITFASRCAHPSSCRYRRTGSWFLCLSRLPHCDRHGANKTAALSWATLAGSQAVCVNVAGTSAELYR